MQTVIKLKNVTKKYKKFELNIPSLEIPKGFATALIGENGAGKTTLFEILAGICLDYQGEIQYFGGEKNEKVIRENIGYTGPNHYFMPHWTIPMVGNISELLFQHFHKDRYEQLCGDMGLPYSTKKISDLSDGMQMKTMLAAVWARDTKMLLLDEPASPLDPVMRDKLCTMIREYLEAGNGEKSVFFSTHNIADMENVTDYAVIMQNGQIAEQGFVEDLKEKYVLVKGETEEAEQAKQFLVSSHMTAFGYEGLCLAENLDKLAGLDIAVETPNLSQISVAIMQQYTNLKY